MGGLTIENNFFILKIEKRNKIIVFDFQKVGAGAQKSGGAAALPAPPPPRSLMTGSSKNKGEIIRENAFEHKKKKPGLSANQPSNNRAQLLVSGFSGFD